MKRIEDSWCGNPKRRPRVLLAALLIICYAVIAPASAQQSPPLTNQDVIDMVSAGLAEQTILLSIQQSPGRFSTGARDLIALKNAGVSPAIMDAMVKKGNASASGSLPDGALLPTAYGYYAVNNGALTELPLTPVEIVFGLKVGSAQGYAVDGFNPSANAVSIDDPHAYFVVHGHELNPKDFQLSRLELLEDLQAGQFNIANTAPQFFSGVYGVPSSQKVDINLLRPKDSIRLRIEPIAGRSGMYRLVPDQPFERGESYAFYTGDSIRPHNVVFTARANQALQQGVYIRVPGGDVGLENGQLASDAIVPTQMSLEQLQIYVAQGLPESDKPREEFEDKKTGLSFSYSTEFQPEVLKVSGTSIVLRPRARTEAQQDPVIYVEAGKIPRRQPDPDLGQVISRQVAATQSTFNSPVVTGPVDTTLAGQPGRIFVVEGTRKGLGTKQASIVGIGNKRWLIVSLVAPDAVFDEHLDEFKRIYQSLRLF